MDPSRRMVYPYTITAKLVQFPYKYYLKNSTVVRFYVLSLPFCAYLFYKLQKLSYSPGNMARYEARRKKEHEEHLAHLEHLQRGFRVVQREKNRFCVAKGLPPRIQVRSGFGKFVRTISTTKNLGQKSRKARYDKDSDSDSDSDDEGSYSKERGESEFWKTKMRTLHRILDVNKDGILSFDDFKLLTERFTDLGHLDPAHHDEFQEKVKEAWETQRGAVDPYNLVTTEQFLEDMHHILNDKTLRKKVHGFLPFLFKAVDQSQDGQLCIEDFKIFFACLGLSEGDAICSFRTIDVNGDGKISLDEFVRLGREYLLTEDHRKPSRLFWGPLVDDHYHKS